MPPFEYLGMEKIQKLTTYIQSLGMKDADQRMARQRYWKEEVIKAYEAGPEYNTRWLAEHGLTSRAGLLQDRSTQNAALSPALVQSRHAPTHAIRADSVSEG